MANSGAKSDPRHIGAHFVTHGEIMENKSKR